MIVLENLTKIFRIEGRTKVVADRINAVFPTGVSVGLLGRNGAGKSTLLKLIAGTSHPTSGRILSTGTVSFPVGLASSLHADLTGAQNTRFVARIYGADTQSLMDFVEDFAELGEHFHLPVRTYSSGMRGRLSFGINMGLEFDTYLVDEVTAVGDAGFKAKSRDLFLSRMKTSGAIYVSHSLGQVRELCTAGAFLENGQLSYYEDVEEAIERYMSTLDHSLSRARGASLAPARNQKFPADARMLYGMGLRGTRFDWLFDVMRKHRPCHFPRTREPHYFDIRAGISEDLRARRLAAATQLSSRLAGQSGDDLRHTLRRLREVSDLLTLQMNGGTDQTGHDDYIAFMTATRSEQPILCDFTPDYALLARSDFEDMAQIGWARFTAVLRDPASRAWALLWEGLPQRLRDPQVATNYALRLISEGALEKAVPDFDLRQFVTTLESVAGRERVFWLFDEDLTGTESLRPLCDWLDIPGVPAFGAAPLPDRPEPEMPEVARLALRKALAPQYEFARKRFGQMLPQAWRLATSARASGAGLGVSS